MEFTKDYFESLDWVKYQYPIGSIHEVEHDGKTVKAKVVHVFQPPLQTQFVSVPVVRFETIEEDEDDEATPE